MADYLTQIDEQAAYLAKSARSRQKFYLACRSAMLIFAGATTVFAAVRNYPVLTTVLSAFTTLAVGFEATWKPKELWVLYRVAREKLRSERRLFDGQLLHYQDATNRPQLYASRCEQILAEVNGTFNQLGSK